MMHTGALYLSSVERLNPWDTVAMNTQCSTCEKGRRTYHGGVQYER